VAIKGKSKSRGAKTVSSGPKPAYVAVKTPLLRRRSLWTAVGVLLGLAALGGIAYGFAKELEDGREQERLDAMAAAINDYRGLIEPILVPLGEAIPPSGFAAFPTLGSSIAALQAEEVDRATVEAAATEAEASVTRAESAAELFGEIVPTDLVAGKGFEDEPDFILYVINSQDGFVRAMNLYKQAALLLADASEAEEGADRDELVARASDVYGLAGETFGRAYGDYVEAQAQAGALQGFPGGLTGALLTGPTG
jgi:hypothetical protein